MANGKKGMEISATKLCDLSSLQLTRILRLRYLKGLAYENRCPAQGFSAVESSHSGLL